MKKLMGFLFVLVFILGIIFVLLPFLETTPPPSAVPAAQARPRPQIFTSNPLTTLVKRIVNALQTEWDKKREKRRLAVARMQEKRKLAPTNYRAALLKTLPSQEEAPGEPIELPQGEDDGNWLIAPQISPEDMGVKGMHEVNTDEELSQSAEMQATEQPLQALPLLSPTEENASFSAQKEPLLLARANTNLQLPKPARYAPEPTKTQAPLSETEKALKELMDVVYPERRLAKLVEDYASVKFGLIPATPASLKEKEAFIKEKKEQVIKEFRRLQWEDIMRMLDSQESPPPPAKDYLGNYVRAAKREGKETIDLPITIVSKGEEGKVRLTKTDPTDVAKIKEAMEAVEAARKVTSSQNKKTADASKEEEEKEAIAAGKVLSASVVSMQTTMKSAASGLWRYFENKEEGDDEAKEFTQFENYPRNGTNDSSNNRLFVNGKIQGIPYESVEIVTPGLIFGETVNFSAIPWMTEEGESNNVNPRNGDSLLNLSQKFNEDTTELAEGSGEQPKGDTPLVGTFEGSLIATDRNGNINFYASIEEPQQALEQVQHPLSFVGTNYARNHNLINY